MPLFDCLLCPLLLCDILDGTLVIKDFALFIPNRPDIFPDPDHLAVPSYPGCLKSPDETFALNEVLPFFLILKILVGLGRRSKESLAAGITQDVGDGRVSVHPFSRRSYPVEPDRDTVK